jgi:putative toxin-antitoxin system antitoxin component (TIGR02293 family)
MPRGRQKSFATPLDVHDAILAGLPASVLAHAGQHFSALRDPATFARVLGISTRTFQRLRDTPTKKLDPALGGRLWRFAEIVSKATDVLGSQQAAEAWMDAPSMALDQRRPIDLMATTAGAALVEALLDRLDHGVYTRGGRRCRRRGRRCSPGRWIARATPRVGTAARGRRVSVEGGTARGCARSIARSIRRRRSW